jgi:hypothetical protein
MFRFFNAIQAAWVVFLEEMLPSLAVRKYKKKIQEFQIYSDMFRRVYIKLMWAYHKSGKTSDALIMYQGIMREPYFFSATEEPKGIEGSLLYEIAYFQSSVLKDPVLAKDTAERAAEIAIRYNAKTVLALLKIDFPECVPAA